MRARVAGLAALLCLAACEGGGDPVQQALRDTAAANHAATVKETTFVSSSPEAITAAGARSADQAYVAEMIAHHRRAIAMAETVLQESRDPDVRRMAQAVIDARIGEIAEMQAWTPGARP